MKKRIFAPRFLPRNIAGTMRHNGARVYFSCSRCFLSRKAAKGSCSFLSGAKEKEHKRKLLPVALLSAFCGAAVSQASTGRHTPKGTADKTVTQRHSANNAALRQIYFVQLLSSATHRAPHKINF